MNRSSHAGVLAIAATSALMLASSPALAGPPKEHFDIWLQPVTGPNGPQIATGSITEGSPGTPINEIERVFGAEFGEEPGFPFSTDHPGLQALPGPLTAGMTWSFNITAGLGKWNGDGFDAAAETMLIEFGPASVTSGAGFVSGFNFTGDASGLLHTHFDFTLQASAQDGGDPTDGIYLLTLEFLGVNGSTNYAASDPAFLVFNLNLDEEDHEAAIEWVQDNLVPAPASLLLLCGIVVLPARRRRVE